MTKISQYPEITTPDVDDLLIGTDVENSNATKNFTVQSIIDLVPTAPYKVYTALLSQSGENAPVATVLENTIGIIPTFNYLGVGFYNISFNEESTDNYWFSITKTDNDHFFLQKSTTNIGIITTSLIGNAENGALFNTPIEIRVYE